MERPEIVIGLVYTAGTNMEPVCTALSRTLATVGYQEKPIRLSKLLEVTPLPPEHALKDSPFDDYLDSRMSAGNYWRETLVRGDAMALLGISNIRAERKAHHGDTEKSEERPIYHCAFVIRSLKHPDEVSTLREVYGPSFFLLSIFEPKDQRIDHLARQIASSHHTTQFDRYRSKATDLIDRDDAEDGKKLGQQVRETFWQGDAFISVGNAESLEKQLRRIVEIWFGHPFHTPTRDEYLMFSAQAAAYRSASLGRQVGAVIATPEGSILATGTNEVPAAGGGVYWSDDASDARDHVIGHDSSDVMRRDLLGDIIRRLKDNEWITEKRKSASVDNMVEELLYSDPSIMKGAIFMYLTEFQRPVHAEMTALTDAARLGVPVEGCTLFATTFPCHVCARHIVSSGIKRVVYIEPYVKSLAQNLHKDAINLGDSVAADHHVRFEPFVGLAPRRYMELFEMTKRKEKDGTALKWLPEKASPRLNGWFHYLTVINENKVIYQTGQALKQAGLVGTSSEPQE